MAATENMPQLLRVRVCQNSSSESSNLNVTAAVTVTVTVTVTVEYRDRLDTGLYAVLGLDGSDA